MNPPFHRNELKYRGQEREREREREREHDTIVSQ